MGHCVAKPVVLEEGTKVLHECSNIVDGTPMTVYDANDNPFDHPRVKQTGRVAVARSLWRDYESLPIIDKQRHRMYLLEKVVDWKEMVHDGSRL